MPYQAHVFLLARTSLEPFSLQAAGNAQAGQYTSTGSADGFDFLLLFAVDSHLPGCKRLFDAFLSNTTKVRSLYTFPITFYSRGRPRMRDME